MALRSRALLCLSATLLCLQGCARKPSPAAQRPAASADATPSAPAAKRERPKAPKRVLSYYSADLALQGLDDLLVASDKLAVNWSQPTTMGSRDLLATFLGNLGFASNVLERMHLERPIYAHFDLPHDPQALRDHFDLALSLPARDPKALLAALPSSLELKEKGAGRWEGKLSNRELKLQGGADFLSIAGSKKNLARAQKDRSAAFNPNLPRVQLTLQELSDEQRRAVYNSIPPQLAKLLAPALNELSKLGLQLDAGSERPATGKVWGLAPWDKLALPLGAPTQTQSELALKLPSGPAFVAQVMLGDTTAFFTELESKLTQVPAPFDEPATQLLTAMKELSAQVKSQGVAAYYMDSKNRGTLLFAVDLKDDKAGLSAVESMWTALGSGLSLQAQLVESSAQDKFKVVQKNKGPRVSGQRLQSLNVSVPKRLAQDLEPQRELSLITPLVTSKGRNRSIEGYSFVREGYAVLALGAGSKTLLTQAVALAKAKGKKAEKNLEAKAGLSAARALSKGCQVCGFIDPITFLRAVAVHGAAESGRKKELKTTLKELDAVKIEGLVSGSVLVQGQQGEMAMQVPESLVFPEPAQAQKLTKAIESFQTLDDIIPKAADLQQSTR